LFSALDYRPAVVESDADAVNSKGHLARNRYNPPAPQPLASVRRLNLGHRSAREDRRTRRFGQQGLCFPAARSPPPFWKGEALFQISNPRHLARCGLGTAVQPQNVPREECPSRQRCAGVQDA
jgi:hypothetical protein